MTSRTLSFTGLIILSAITHASGLTFEEALSQSRRGRDIIISAQHRVKRSQAEAAALRALPPVTLGIGLSSPTGFGATDQDLSLQQGLDLFGRRADLRHLGFAKVEATQSELRAALLQVQSDTARAFIEAAAAKESLKYASEITRVAENLLKATERRVEAGRAPEVQALRAKLELERCRLAENERGAAAKLALLKLAAAIGRESVEDTVGGINLRAPSGVEGRPDLLLLNSQVSGAKAEEAAARKQSRPEAAISLHRSPWGEASRLGLRLQIAWNLLDGGKAKEEARAAEQQRLSLERAFQDKVKQATAEADQLEEQIRAARGSLQILEGLSNDLRTLLEKTTRGFEEGVGTLVEVLEAVRSLREVDLERSEAERKIKLLQVDLLDAKGALLEAMK